MNRSTRSTPLLGAALALGLLLSACGGGQDAFSSDDGGGGGDGAASGGAITVGGSNFPENELLMQIYAGALDDAGVEVRTQGVGAREIYVPALEDGSIDVMPEYNGALLAYLQPDGVPQDVNTPEEVGAALQDVLPEGLETLEQSAAENKDVVTVTRETAERYSLTSIEDLEPIAGDLVAGGSPEWRQRYQGLRGLEEVYGLTFKQYRPLDVGGPLTVQALADGDIDVADIFSTDSANQTQDFVGLEDPKNLFTSQNITPLIRSDKVTPEVTEALNEVSAALTTENLTAALARVQVDREDPATVAADFLKTNGLT